MMYTRLAAAAATPPEKLAGEPGFLAAYLLEKVGLGQPEVLSFWAQSTATDHEVVDDWSGPAAGKPPTAALVLHFDGPLSPAAYAAGQRAGRDRIQPALAAVPGIVRLVSLWQPQDRSVSVVNLAESMDALEAGSRAANSTTLLPGEDPALLPGPDRVEAYRVVSLIGPRP
jgi:hypothetical protein